MLNLFDVLSPVAKSYESKSVWAFHANLVPLIPLSDTCQLNADKYDGFRLKIAAKNAAGETEYFYPAIHKDSIPAAKNNHTSWKIDLYIASREYNGVALTNGETLELSEYETKKAELSLLGVTIDANRQDKGIITIPKFNPDLPIEHQKASCEQFAVAVI